jgi:hypothetical protein
MMAGTGGWQLRDCERVVTGNAGLLDRKHFLIGVTRLRNEQLILLGRSLDAARYYPEHGPESVELSGWLDLFYTEYFAPLFEASMPYGRAVVYQ